MAQNEKRRGFLPDWTQAAPWQFIWVVALLAAIYNPFFTVWRWIFDGNYSVPAIAIKVVVLLFIVGAARFVVIRGINSFGRLGATFMFVGLGLLSYLMIHYALQYGIGDIKLFTVAIWNIGCSFIFTLMLVWPTIRGKFTGAREVIKPGDVPAEPTGDAHHA